MTTHEICCDDCKVRMFAGNGYGIPLIRRVDDDEKSDPLAMFFHKHMGHRLTWVDEDMCFDGEQYEYSEVDWDQQAYEFVQVEPVQPSGVRSV